MEKFSLQMSGKLNKHNLIKLFYEHGVFNLEKNKYNLEKSQVFKVCFKSNIIPTT